ncbi:MAG: hypothetical protein Q9187_002639, partial [Circinaria calcarea]
VNEFVKFISPFRILWLVVLAWQFVATAFSVLGAVLGMPISWVEENVIGGNGQRRLRDVIMGWTGVGEANAEKRHGVVVERVVVLVETEDDVK